MKSMSEIKQSTGKVEVSEITDKEKKKDQLKK